VRRVKPFATLSVQSKGYLCVCSYSHFYLSIQTRTHTHTCLYISIYIYIYSYHFPAQKHKVRQGRSKNKWRNRSEPRAASWSFLIFTASLNRSRGHTQTTRKSCRRPASHAHASYSSLRGTHVYMCMWMPCVYKYVYAHKCIIYIYTICMSAG
jgi:hypothetical protein